MYEITRAKHLSQALVHFVTARASLFTDHNVQSAVARQIEAFLENWEANCLTVLPLCLAPLS